MLREEAKGRALMDELCVLEYWPDKWRERLKGLTAAELSVVILVAHGLRCEKKKRGG